MNKTGSVCVKSTGSLVSVVTSSGTERVGTGVSMPNKGRDFYLQSTKNASGDHTATWRTGSNCL